MKLIWLHLKCLVIQTECKHIYQYQGKYDVKLKTIQTFISIYLPFIFHNGTISFCMFKLKIKATKNIRTFVNS